MELRLAASIAGRLLGREWRAGELRVLSIAIVIAVGSLCAVAVFTDRVERAMAAGASELLAADLLVHSTEPIPDAYERHARAAGLTTARTVTFRSMVVDGDRFVLVAAKSVSPAYPLRGALRIADAAYGTSRASGGVPEPGSVWIDPRLAGAMAFERGDTLALGRARLRIAQVLAYEPDRGGDLFQAAPRVLLNEADLARTGLIAPGSHVHYRLLLAGGEQEVARVRGWLAERVGEKEELQGVEDGRPEMRAALTRANQFLGLAALVSALLCSVAILVAARRHARRHFDVAALMRCLGASRRLVGSVYTLELLFLGTGASALGVALGYLAQAGLAILIGEFFVDDLPAPSRLPVLFGLSTGLVVLVGFAWPPLVRLRRVPPMRVLRREAGALPPGAAGAYLAALGALAGLIVWQAKEITLAAYVLAGSFATALVLLLFAFALVRSLAALRSRVGVSWRFGIAAIARRAEGSMVQMMAFGVGIALLLLLGVVRHDLLLDWRRSLPPGTPNYFLVNIQPDEVEALGAWLAERGLETVALHPMVGGRLVEINGRKVSPGDYSDPEAERLAARDFQLSWADRLQDDNRIVAGRWFGPEDHGRAVISVEDEIAATLGFALGDELVFSAAGVRVPARVTSLREVQWDSFQANFFVLFPPEVLDGLPATWLSSFHLPEAERPLLADLVRRFPSVTVFDIDVLLARVRALMEQAARAAQYVFLFTLAAGFVVLMAAVHASLDERRYETAVVRTLGAGRSHVVRGLLAEFATLGGLAGVLAAIAASVTGAVLAVEIFDMPYRVNPWVWVVGIAGGAIGVGAAGLVGTRRVIDEPPLNTLRQG